MISEDLPLAAKAADKTTGARAAGGERLATVRADFFLDPIYRLTEQERALMTAMLHCLVSDIATELRARIPSSWTPANDHDNLALVDELTAARLLDEPDLIALLLRRADEERIGAGARARSGRRDSRFLQGLVSHQDGETAAAAMALILARGRRRDRFGQCLVALDDCSPAVAHALVHGVAAAIARRIAADKPVEALDAALTSATHDLLSERDLRRSIGFLTQQLVRPLDEKGALDDEFLLGVASEGEIGFLAHALSRIGGFAEATAFDELVSSNPERLALFLRSAGASRALAAGILASLGDLLGVFNPAEAIDAFDGVSDSAAAAARARLATAPAYRAALSELERNHGHRAR